MGGFMLCAHCCSRPASRPRGLCWTCYHTPAVRALYPGNPAVRRGVRDFFGNPKPPEAPASARPGSDGKIDVLAERAGRGEALWHPGDAEE